MSKREPDVLHVVAVVFNPGKFERRYQLYKEFAQHMAQFERINLHTVELSNGDEDYRVTDHASRGHHQLRCDMPLWYKENLINIGVKTLLPDDWKYVAWIDADLIFDNPDWVEDTIDALKHDYDIIQPFESAVDLGKRDQPISIWKSFGHYNAECSVEPYDTIYDNPPDSPHPSKVTPGFAWACTRKAWDQLGGLLEACIVGSGDYHMAMALLGKVEETFHSKDLVGYNRHLKDWQDRAKGLKLGYISGTVYHRWHGDRKNRQYIERRKIIEDVGFDPARDLVKFENGLIGLANAAVDMVERFLNYFKKRKEDN